MSFKTIVAAKEQKTIQDIIKSLPDGITVQIFIQNQNYGLGAYNPMVAKDTAKAKSTDTVQKPDPKFYCSINGNVYTHKKDPTAAQTKKYEKEMKEYNKQLADYNAMKTNVYPTAPMYPGSINYGTLNFNGTTEAFDSPLEAVQQAKEIIEEVMKKFK